MACERQHIHFILNIGRGRHLIVSAFKDLNETAKKTIHEAIMENEELPFHWTLMMTNADDSVGMEVLRQISELYLIVRGFAFNSCLEMY